MMSLQGHTIHLCGMYGVTLETRICWINVGIYIYISLNFVKARVMVVSAFMFRHFRHSGREPDISDNHLPSDGTSGYLLSITIKKIE